MKLETRKITVQKKAEYIFNELLDVKNFQKLMSEDIAKFEVLDEKTFVFGLKGMPEIKLKLKEQNPYNKIVLGAASDKLPFTLTAIFTEIDEISSEVQLFFKGEFNAMMAMMVKGPISKFMETLSNHMSKL